MKQFFKLTKLYYSLFGKKLVILFSLMVVAVGLEGVGVTLFLPILQGDDRNSPIAKSIQAVFGALGIAYELKNLLLFFIMFFTFRSLFMILQDAFLNKVTSSTTASQQIALVENIFKSKLGYFQHKTLGYYTNLMTNELSRLVSSFDSYAKFVVNMLFAILYILIPFFINPKPIFLMGIGALPAVLFMKKVSKWTSDLSHQNTTKNGQLQSLVIQALRNFKYLKATARTERVTARIAAEGKELARIRFVENTIASGSEYFMEPIVICFIATLIYYYVILKGQPLGEVLFFLFLLYRGFSKVTGLQAIYRKLIYFVGGISAVTKEKKALAENIEIDAPPSSVKIDLLSQPIRFEKVGFGYETQSVFRELSLTIRPRSTVVICGESGSGKTTLVGLAVKLLKPSSGQILIGDLDISTIPAAKIRDVTGYISQESVIFNATVFENISLWDPPTPENLARARNAAEQAQIVEMIDKLPKGFDSILSEDGMNLSGGQRQRISVARELYKDPQLLIFDEATSALDSETEEKLTSSINALRGKKTILIITHRQALLKNADQAYSLQAGNLSPI